MAKKLADMTPFERVSQRLKGLTNEEAEDVAVQILAQVVAKKVVIHGGKGRCVPCPDGEDSQGR